MFPCTLLVVCIAKLELAVNIAQVEKENFGTCITGEVMTILPTHLSLPISRLELLSRHSSVLWVILTSGLVRHQLLALPSLLASFFQALYNIRSTHTPPTPPVLIILLRNIFHDAMDSFAHSLLPIFILAICSFLLKFICCLVFFEVWLAVGSFVACCAQRPELIITMNVWFRL